MSGKSEQAVTSDPGRKSTIVSIARYCWCNRSDDTETSGALNPQFRVVRVSPTFWGENLTSWCRSQLKKHRKSNIWVQMGHIISFCDSELWKTDGNSRGQHWAVKFNHKNMFPKSNKLLFFCQGCIITNRRRRRPPCISGGPAAPPTGFPRQQHPVSEPEEDRQEEEPSHPGQLDHHPGAARSRLALTRRQEGVQPSAVRHHGVTGSRRCNDRTKGF